MSEPQNDGGGLWLVLDDATRKPRAGAAGKLRLNSMDFWAFYCPSSRGQSGNGPTARLFVEDRDGVVSSIAMFPAKGDNPDQLCGGRLLHGGVTYWVNLFRNRKGGERAPNLSISIRLAEERTPASEPMGGNGDIPF